MQPEPLFHHNVLQSLSEGVLALDQNGQIVMFNPAIEKILGLQSSLALGLKFAQIFMVETEGNDHFVQIVLDAVYENHLGQENCLPYFRPDKKAIHIKVTSSYLKDEQGSPQGIILVISDVSQEYELRQQEKNLHEQIRKAYQDQEKTNTSLQLALKKVRMIRITVILFFFLISGSAAGYYFWTHNQFKYKFSNPAVSASSSEQQKFSDFIVQPRSIFNSISLQGKIQPLSQVTITSPFAGKIAAKYFDFGQKIKKGQLLLEIDSMELESKLRDAKSAYIKTHDEYNKLKNWKNSTDVAQARRNLDKALDDVEKAKAKLEETKLLFDKGIESRNTLDNTKDSLLSSERSLIASKEAMQSVLQKGNKKALRIASMDLENKKIRLQELEKKLKHKQIRSSVNGIVIKAADSSQAKSSPLEVGSPLTEGQVLFAVGNLDGITVEAEVDEIDIGRLQNGQQVSLSGDAFAQVKLQGQVTHISSQASASGSSVPMFGIKVEVDKLSPKQRQQVLLGMTANLEIMVYNKPAALLVPLHLVRSKGGRHYLSVRNSTSGNATEIEVKTGITTLDSVEITQGLYPGQAIVQDR